MEPSSNNGLSSLLDLHFSTFFRKDFCVPEASLEAASDDNGRYENSKNDDR